MDDKMLIPDCCCGAGQMTLHCASNKAQHPRRFYYKCPSGKDHKRSFLWCDEYHRQHRPELVPRFLSTQEWSPCSGATSSQTESNFPPAEPNDSKDHKEATGGAQAEPVESVLNELLGSWSVIFVVFTCVLAVFMCFVLVLLGIIIGKIL